MIFSYFLSMLLIISTLGENCDDIMCSNVIDNICGMAKLEDGTKIIMRYQNICHMRKKECELDSVVEINLVPDKLCNIKKKKMHSRHEYQGEARRVFDFSIVGAHQTCNHTCPTYCIDSYEPTCAQIWQRNMLKFTFRPMINHCHTDLFSCAAGLNVTIQPLSKCYKNPSGLMFMQQVAAVKSLGLMDDEPKKRSRRSSKLTDDANVLKEQLLEVVRRIFEKYRKTFN